MCKKQRHREFVKVALFSPFLIILFSCSNPQAERNSHLKAFLPRLEEKTRQILSKGPLTREECIQLALKHNLRLKLAALRTRLSKIQRDLAFSAFLPTIQLQVTRSGYERDLAKKFPFEGTELQAVVRDRYVTDLSWNFLQPVFVPTTWYLYQMRLQGVAEAKYLEQRVAELIKVQVSSLYFRILTLEEREKALEKEIEEAREIKRKTEALLREGLVKETDLTQAIVFLKEKERRLAEIQRLKLSTEGSLLQLMGLDPKARLPLARSPLPQAPSEDVLELLYHALTKRPELFAADLRIKQARAQVYAALARFLPVLNVAVSYLQTTDSLTLHPENWQYGVTAVINLLEGFQRFHLVRQAKTNLEAAKQKRAELCLSIILQVLQAYRSYKNAEQEQDLAAEARDLAYQKLKEAQALFREGVESISFLLAAERAAQEAQAAYLAASYKKALTAVTLADVSGIESTKVVLK